MALDINGYNSTFKSFVQFAEERMSANDAKAVLDAKVNQPGTTMASQLLALQPDLAMEP